MNILNKDLAYIVYAKSFFYAYSCIDFNLYEYLYILWYHGPIDNAVVPCYTETTRYCGLTIMSIQIKGGRYGTGRN